MVYDGVEDKRWINSSDIEVWFFFFDEVLGCFFGIFFGEMVDCWVGFVEVVYSGWIL